jgi:hypothetical protein
MFKITAEIYVEAEGDDVAETGESLAATMERGLRDALAGFPDGEVVGARVDNVTVATDEEAAPYKEDG